MSRLIDLTQTIGLEPGGLVLAWPRGERERAADGRHAAWCKAHGIAPEHLPAAPGFELDVIREATRGWGTQIDAPSHSRVTSATQGAKGVRSPRHARTLDEVDPAELLCDGMVLDLRAAARPGEAISIDALQAAIDAVGRDIRAGDAVLLRTGLERWSPDDPETLNHPGMTREGTLFLTLRGALVLGTDAPAWDRPFAVLERLYRETGDASLLWDGHLAIDEREAFIVRRLANLGALPASGFKVAFFPLKVAGATTGPCRAVAFVDE